MIVFKSFFKVAKRYIGTIIMYTCIFLGITMAIINSQKKNDVESFKSTKLKVAFFDHSESALSKSLFEYINENHVIKENINENLDVFRDEIYNRHIDYVIIIPEDFETTKKVESYKLPGSITSEFMKLSIDNFISTYSAYINNGLSDNEAYTKTVETMKLNTQVTITDKAKAVEYTDEHYYYQYIPYIMLSVICLSLTPVLIAFNTTEVKKRTLCGGITIAKRNIALAAGCFVFTFAITGFYILVSIIQFKDAIFTTAGALRIINTLVFALVALSFAFLFSSLTKNVNVVNMYVNAIGLGSSFICGVFVPREFLGSGVLTAGRFFPAYWYINVEEAASNISNASSSTIIMGLGIQLLFAVAFLSLSLILGNRKKA